MRDVNDGDRVTSGFNKSPSDTYRCVGLTCLIPFLRLSKH